MRALELWQRLVTARPNRVREIWGLLTFLCCFVKCMKSIAKGPVGASDKVGGVVLNRYNSVESISMYSNTLVRPVTVSRP
jgi:hypothetical protein